MPKLSTHDKLAKLKKITFTKQGFEKLQRDYKKLQAERPAAVKELARARELGDLSENGLYTAAKARLGGIDSQLFRMEMTMKFAEVVEGNGGSHISVGSKVTVKNENQETTYEIVGDTEANPKLNKITTKSPIGSALIDKKVGDKAEVLLPSGVKTFLIVRIN